MRLYKRSGSRYWWAEGRRLDNSIWRHSTKQTDKGAASLAGKLLERRELLGADDSAPTATLADGLDAMKAADERAGKPAGTVEYHRTKGGHLARLLGPACPLASIDAAALRSYADTRIGEGAHRHTVQKEIVVLRYGAKLAGVPIPVEHVPDLGRFYVPRTRWLTIEELRRLHFATLPARRDWLTVFCGTGVRWSELYRIEARDLDPARRRLVVRVTKTDDVLRSPAISDDALDVLVRRAKATPTGPLFPAYGKHPFRELMRRACARIGIEMVTPNDLRRTYCSWLAFNSVPEGRAAKYLGNSARMVRLVYAQIADQSAIDDGANLPRIFGRSTHSSPHSGGGVDV